MTSCLKTAQQICEDILLEEKRYNTEHNILTSENTIVDRLLKGGPELRDAYTELYDKLYTYPLALHDFLGLILSTAAFWNPESIQDSRTDCSDLGELNQQIARKAEELAGLIDQRSELLETSSFTSDTHYHVGRVIEAAAVRHVPLFRGYLQGRLNALMYQFDLKYWPSIGQFLRELAADAGWAKVEPTNPITAAATTSERPSKADFFKALFAAINENSAKNYGRLPQDLKITDRTFASLANCLLALDADELVDETYVKRLRQRLRESTN